MGHNRVVGNTLRWRFDDGSAADKTYIHKFNDDGSVDFREVINGKHDKETHVDKYESSHVNDDTCAVSYRGPEGYTLTTILDFKTGKLLAFASNESMLEKSHGEFEEVIDDPSVDQAAAELAESSSR